MAGLLVGQVVELGEVIDHVDSPALAALVRLHDVDLPVDELLAQLLQVLGQHVRLGKEVVLVRAYPRKLWGDGLTS